jgi:1-acyl-sn-glycerol-3-phosphate acyltransferase
MGVRKVCKVFLLHISFYYTIHPVPPSYEYPLHITFAILRDFLLGRKRSFVRDAAFLRKGISRLEISGDIPRGEGPYLFLVNHYSHPGFRAWWIAIALTAATARDLHWPMTSAWTYPDPLRSRLITPLTRWVLARVARMYSFTLMPPMPPRESDTAARAAAVRRLLRRARNEKPSIGMAPEGMDSSDGRLMQSPSGAGRFIAHLAEAGYTPLPVGVYEEGDAFHVRFGTALAIPPAAGIGVGAYDRKISILVMEKIGEMLPDTLTPHPSPGVTRERGEG